MKKIQNEPKGELSTQMDMLKVGGEIGPYQEITLELNKEDQSSYSQIIFQDEFQDPR